MDLTLLLGDFLKLGGVASLVVVLVNIGKAIGIVKDGTALNWSAGLNLLGFGLFFFAQLLNFDIAPVDTALGGIANVLIALLTLLSQFGTSRLMNVIVRGVPIVGFSHSLRLRSG